MARTPDPTPASEQPFATEEGAATHHLVTVNPDPRWRLVDRIVVAAFVIGLLIPGLLLVAGKRPPQLENRPLLKPPAFSVAGALDASWPAKVDAYLADNMALRGIAVRVRGELYWRTGGTGNPDVIPGRDGWVFVRGEFEPICNFSAEEVAASLATSADRFEAAGQEFRFLVAPDKHTIYPDRVRPDLTFPPACNEVGRPALQAALAAMAPVTVDGIRALADARREAPAGPELFYHMDTHWTPSGAILAIGALIRSLDPTLWRDEDIVTQGDHRRTLDLARQIGIRRMQATPKLVVRPGMTLHRKDVGAPGDIGSARTVFRVTAIGDRPTLQGRTLVIYDSFFGISMPLVAPFFAETTWIHVGDMANHPELAAGFGPFDRVIFERVERGLYEKDIASIVDLLIARP